MSFRLPETRLVQQCFMFVILLSLICVIFWSPLKVCAEDTGACPTCNIPSGNQQTDYLSDTAGFKATKAITSAGKCVISVFFPAKKAALDLLNGVSLTQDAVEFIDKVQKEKPDWLATADTGVTAVNFASNLAQVLSTQYADQLEAMTNKAGGYLPGFSVVLACGSTGYDVYKLITSYIDAVDFAVDTIAVTPVRTSLAKNDFFYPAQRWPDGSYAEKYQGDKTWRVDLRLRQIGGDPAQIGTHWDRLYTMQHWNNGVPLGLFYFSDNNDLVVDGSSFGSTPGVATSPNFYTILNESAYAGTQGVRAGTNTYEIMVAYSGAGFLGLTDGEEHANTYFSVYPDADIPTDPDDPTPVIDEMDDDEDDDDDSAPPQDPPFRTPGRDHADENLSVANKDVPDKTPTDLRNAYTRLATAKGFDLVKIRELLKEARQAEKYYLDLLSQDPENPEYHWKWAGATHRIKTHMAALNGKEKEMIRQYLKTPNVAVLDRGYTDRAIKLLRDLHIPTARVGINFSPDMAAYHPILFIPSAGLYGLDGSDVFKARLEEYTQNGGTIVCLTQQHGYDFETLPGGELSGYGWLEDQSCHTRSMSIAQIHPLLSGQDDAILDAGVDGFFTDLPQDTQVLLKRTKNNMPAAVVYPYGAGQVVALCVYSDWISGLGGETADDRALLADIIHWAESAGADLPEHLFGQPVEVSVTVTNTSDEAATHVLYYVLRPDGTVFSSELGELSLAAGQSQPVNLTLPGGTPDQPGLWCVDYVLLDFDGVNRVMDFEEPEVQLQRPGTYFQVRKDIEAVTALNTFNFYITSSQEVFFKNETGTFTFNVANNSTADQTFRIEFYFHHHSYEYSRDTSLYGGQFHPIVRELFVATGSEASFDYTVPILGGDRIFAKLTSPTGSVWRTTDRQIMLQRVTEIIDIQSQQETYEGAEPVGIDFSIAPTAGRELSGEARVTIRDPENQLVCSLNPIPLSGTDPMNLSLSEYVLPATAIPGYYQILVEIYDSYGIRTGGMSSSFVVPEKPVYASLALPEAIDPQTPAVFVMTLSNNTGDILSDCTLNFYVDAPDGSNFFHHTLSMASLPINANTYSIDVDFSTIFALGQYTARYEFSCPEPAILRQGQKSFARSFSYNIQMEKYRYLPTETATVQFTAANTGIFNEPLSVHLAMTGTTVDIQENYLLTAGDIFKSTCAFTLPALGKGAYGLQCLLENFTTLTKSTSVIIKPEELDISFPMATLTGGSIYPVKIKSPNPVPLDYTYHFTLMDYFGDILFEASDGLSIPAESETSVDITLPAVLAAGDYAIVFDIVDPLNDARVQQRKTALTLTSGLSVDIVSQPNQDPYATGETAILTTQVTATNTVEISNAQLEVSAISTIDTGEIEWARKEDLLGGRFTPFDLPVGNLNMSLVFIDLDGDEDKDMVAYFETYLLFYENESILDKQKWTRRTDWATGYTVSDTSALTMGDLNNDGRPDMIAIDGTMALHGFKNVGTGSTPAWEPDASLTSGLPATYSVWATRLIDIDFDGDLDFYAVASTGAKYGYRNTGSVDAPTFTADTSGLCSGLASRGQNLIFVHLNDDDLLDLVTVNRYYSPYTIEFYLKTTLDASTDITWQLQSAETITWTYNQPSENRWGFENLWGLGTVTEMRFGTAKIQGMVDINGDEREDLVICDAYGDIYAYLDHALDDGNLAGEAHYFAFDGQMEILEPFTHVGYSDAPAMSFADLDADGNDEMVTINLIGTPSQNACVLQNIGTTAHPEWKRNRALELALNSDIAFYQSYYGDYVFIRNIAMADINGDGRKDCLTYGGNPSISDYRQWQIWAYENQGGNSPDFTLTNWMTPVWTTMPHHYRPQPYEAARLVDRSFKFRVRDFDGDGDQDLFISYSWERYVYSYEDYRDTRGTFVAYENTGSADAPVFTRKTSWETGLSEVILSTSRQYFSYGVDLTDVDNDGICEAIVTKNPVDGVTMYRYNGTAWVLDDTLAAGLTPDAPSYSWTPNFLDIDRDGNMDIAITVGYTGGVETYVISREEAFEAVETTNHTFTGTLTHETNLGVLPVPGRMNISAILKSEQGQVLGDFSDQFYVLDSGQSVLLRLKPDKSGYKAGDSATLTGLIRNLGALDITGTPVLSNKHTGEVLGLNESITLAPDEEYPFSVTVDNLNESFFAQLALNEFSTLTRVTVIEPELTISVDIPTAVKGDGNLQATVSLANPTSIPIDITLSVDHQTDNLSVLPNQTASLIKSFTIDQTTTFVFEISGDYLEAIQKTVEYETGAMITMNAHSSYPYGTILIPYTVSNSGELDDNFSLEFSGDLVQTVALTAPAGSETEYVLEVDGTKLGYGNHLIQWQTPSQQGTIAFSLVRNNDPVITAFNYTGLTGTDADGFTAEFTCTVKNQGINAFTGTLSLEIPNVSRKQTTVILDPGQEQEFQLMLPAPMQNGTYTCQAAVLLENQALTSTQTTFDMVSGLVITQFPEYLTGAANTALTFNFSIQNNGLRPESMDALFAIPFGFGDDNSRHSYLNPGDQIDLSFTDYIPDDVPSGAYTATLKLNGVEHEVPFTVSGVDIDVSAALDKLTYTLDPADSCTLSLSVTNADSTFNGTALYAVATYDGNQQIIDFTLQDTNTLNVTFDVTEDNGRINWGIYQTGRSLVLNDVLVRTASADLSLATDKTSYLAGESVSLPFTPDVSGTLTLQIPDVNWEQTYEAIAGQALEISIPLAADLSSGTYVLVARLDTGIETHTRILFFDVYGRSIRPKAFTLSKEKYFPTDEIQAVLNIESNMAFEGQMEVAVSTEAGSVSDLYSGPVSIDNGSTDITFTGAFETHVSGTHFVNVTITALDDAQTEYMTCSKAFDVGGIVLLGISTDQLAYPSDTESVSLHVRAFGTEPGTADISINGAHYTSVQLIPQSPVEELVDIPATDLIPGDVSIKAAIVSNGLETTKETAFFFAQDLPDLIPTLLDMTWNGTETVVTASVKNIGGSTAASGHMAFSVQAGDSLGTVDVSNLSAGQSATGSIVVGSDLSGETLIVVASLSANEKDTTNNTLTRTFDAVNQAPEVTFVGPGTDAPYDDAYEVVWTASDADSDPLAVDIHLDTDTNPGNGTIPMRLNLPDTGSALINMTTVPTGIYYVFVQVKDDSNASATAYSTGRIGIVDMDEDGVRDEFDNCPEDYNPGQEDGDADGYGDACDVFPSDDTEWADTDSDGIGDNSDGCPADADKVAPGVCGCGLPDVDTDGDEVLDCEDAFPDNGDEWEDFDEDGIGNNADLDDDDDGMPDTWESAYGLNPFYAGDADTDLDGDGLSNLDEFLDDRDPTNQPPVQPILQQPENAVADVALPGELATGDYEDPDDHAHAATIWQISIAEDDFSEDHMVLAMESSSWLTSLEVPDFVLQTKTAYYWRVKFIDDGNEPSDWSDTFMFTTAAVDEKDPDADGVPNDQEITDPAVDLDGDNIADMSQTDLLCANTIIGNGQIAVKGVTNVASVDAVSTIDPNQITDTNNRPQSLPMGLVSFRVSVTAPGDTAEVQVYFSEPAPANAEWYKYDIICGWQNYSSHAVFASDRLSVTLTLTDGGSGDADGAVNGVIVDPSGMSVAASNPPSSDGDHFEEIWGRQKSCFIDTLADDVETLFAILGMVAWLLVMGCWIMQNKRHP